MGGALGIYLTGSMFVTQRRQHSYTCTYTFTREVPFKAFKTETPTRWSRSLNSLASVLHNQKALTTYAAQPGPADRPELLSAADVREATGLTYVLRACVV